MKTKVIYHKYPEGDVIALFPQEAADRRGYYCESYQHTGQHAMSDPKIARDLYPASPSEYASLHRELISIGYDLTIGERVSSFDNALRMARAKKSTLVTA